MNNFNLYRDNGNHEKDMDRETFKKAALTFMKQQGYM
jgi:hypothetical protein